MKSVQRVWRGSDSAYQSHDDGEGGESATFGSLKEPQRDLQVRTAAATGKMEVETNLKLTSGNITLSIIVHRIIKQQIEHN